MNRRHEEEPIEVFEPWTDFAALPPRNTPPHARTTPPFVPSHPATGLSARWRSVSPLAFGAQPVPTASQILRSVGVPAMKSVGDRLEAARHFTMIQDLLDLPDPSLRMLIWPHPGSFGMSEGRTQATLELRVESGDEPTVVASHWFASDPTHPIVQARAPLVDADLPWLRTQVVDFVESVLVRV
ncbi:MAG: hypothetical protein OEZ65_11755 [Gemmatimonadota bacterium]|nr:hypothetical protein [Gemmatimonadota bacterium]MDH5760256.1 hypothetical protein [Gemmatimonadota bacterium]